MKKNSILTDSISLACVKILTMIVSIVSTMILSKNLDLVSFGTYSTANLIINTATSISALGLLDAINYYYNTKKENREKYVNNVFSLVLFNGIVIAVLILIFARQIQYYFHNPMLSSIFIYIVFRPVLGNFGLGLQNLQVSIGKAKSVAIRNAVITLCKLVAIILVAFLTKDIKTIFVIMLIVETLSILYFVIDLYKNNVRINPLKFDIKLLKEILLYCIPMGIYIQTSVISRDLDKYVIGFFESVENLAIYSNVSTKLPLDILSGPLLMVLLPILTVYMSKRDYKTCVTLFKSNVKIGYIITLILGTALLVLSEPTILFLYGENYLPGKSVFIIYLLVDMVNFMSFSIILGAKGKTKILMIISVISLIINLIINYLFYMLFGFVGPAIATLFVTIFTNLILLHYSCKELECTIFDVLEIKHLSLLILELTIFGIVFNRISNFMSINSVHYFINLSICSLLFIGIMILLNFKQLRDAIDNLKK